MRKHSKEEMLAHFIPDGRKLIKYHREMRKYVRRKAHFSFSKYQGFYHGGRFIHCKVAQECKKVTTKF